jgi:hypothetical protein
MRKLGSRGLSDNEPQGIGLDGSERPPGSLRERSMVCNSMREHAKSDSVRVDGLPGPICLVMSAVPGTEAITRRGNQDGHAFRFKLTSLSRSGYDVRW